MEGGEDMVSVTKLAASDKDMEAINRFAKRKLIADEVYTFEVMAADTQVDRDGEYFTADTLAGLAELYIGKAMITDHDPKTGNQTARIYHAYTKQDGEVTRLMVQAYMLRAGNEPLIDRIDAGIIKEVSVGCAVRQKMCSICGKEYGKCRHQKGKTYGDAVCAVALDGAVDAYEISFVAVPAQKEAGVIKCTKSLEFSGGQTEDEDALKAKQELQEQAALRIRLAAAANYLKERDTYGNEHEDV